MTTFDVTSRQSFIITDEVEALSVKEAFDIWRADPANIEDILPGSLVEVADYPSKMVFSFMLNGAFVGAAPMETTEYDVDLFDLEDDTIHLEEGDYEIVDDPAYDWQGWDKIVQSFNQPHEINELIRQGLTRSKASLCSDDCECSCAPVRGKETD